jgi:hypothetical protein
MWKKIAIAGAVGAAIVGVGTAALATSGPTTTPGKPAPKSDHKTSKSADGKNHGRNAVRHALHAQWVTPNKDGKTFVTHDAIRGSVTAVSPTSITIQSADKKSETYTVTSATKVRTRTNGKGAKATISQVHVGDKAFVIGTGTTTLTARGILDAGKGK